jgi:hypothetical protein
MRTPATANAAHANLRHEGIEIETALCRPQRLCKPTFLVARISARSVLGSLRPYKPGEQRGAPARVGENASLKTKIRNKIQSVE